MCGWGSLPVLLRGREGWLKARWRSVFEGLWEFRAVHPPLLPPAMRGAPGEGSCGQVGSCGRPERGVRAGPGGVSQGSSAPIVRPGGRWPVEPSARRWSCGLRAPAPASNPAGICEARGRTGTRQPRPGASGEGHGARRLSQAPQVPEPRGT